MVAAVVIMPTMVVVMMVRFVVVAVISVVISVVVVVISVVISVVVVVISVVISVVVVSVVVAMVQVVTLRAALFGISTHPAPTIARLDQRSSTALQPRQQFRGLTLVNGRIRSFGSERLGPRPSVVYHLHDCCD